MSSLDDRRLIAASHNRFLSIPPPQSFPEIQRKVPFFCFFFVCQAN